MTYRYNDLQKTNILMKTSDRNIKVAPLFKVWFSWANAAAKLETSISELAPKEFSVS